MSKYLELKVCLVYLLLYASSRFTMISMSGIYKIAGCKKTLIKKLNCNRGKNFSHFIGWLEQGMHC